MPEQKEAHKHETADGKNRRCAYSDDKQSYYCIKREFVCADNRTKEDSQGIANSL